MLISPFDLIFEFKITNFLLYLSLMRSVLLDYLESDFYS